MGDYGEKRETAPTLTEDIGDCMGMEETTDILTELMNMSRGESEQGRVRAEERCIQQEALAVMEARSQATIAKVLAQFSLKQEENKTAQLESDKANRAQQKQIHEAALISREQLAKQQEKHWEAEIKRQNQLRKAQEAEKKARQAEEEKKQCLKAISLPAPMSSRTDLGEHLKLYKWTMMTKEIPKDQWTNFLSPLLNDKFRGIALKLELEECQD